jgi:hypothetical protein
MVAWHFVLPFLNDGLRLIFSLFFTLLNVVVDAVTLVSVQCDICEVFRSMSLK